MKKVTFYAAVLFSAMTMFSACSSKSDDPTPEKPSQEEVDAQHLAAMKQTADSTYAAIIAGDWKLEKFIPSDDMLKASQTPDGAPALTIINKAKGAIDFGLTLDFHKEVNGQKIVVDTKNFDDLSQGEKDKKCEDLQVAIYGFGYDVFKMVTEDNYAVEIFGAYASPFATDEASTDDITDKDTGEVKVAVNPTDFSSFDYENMLMHGKEVVLNNTDKIYFQDGKLVVESTEHTYKYGVSQYIFAPAK
ncbi:hypothetical protein [Persicobacter psychrovividus]|uniref:Lipoprotein n=1 Tax=Persicobacter psychrovividus TaxID=387638 RepID=A0ABN6L656_9BACT|nr:hypothetical protein PEPS_09350 [Persicobacter psychrovividus]